MAAPCRRVGSWSLLQLGLLVQLAGAQFFRPGGYDWREVPPLDFSYDGPAAPAEYFRDNGLLHGELPRPDSQWQGKISADLASYVRSHAYFQPVDSIDNLVLRAIDNELVLLVSGASYQVVLMNAIWILEKRFKIFNYGIACMDDVICGWLEAIGRRHVAYRMTESRLVLAYQLIAAGVDLIITDLDAVWIRNPIPHLRLADITGQRDRHPRELFETWGSTFCTGLLGIRSTPMTVKFMQGYIAMHNPQSKFLDQRTFNQAIYRAGVDWFGKTLVHSWGESKTVDRGVLRNFENMTVALLPQDPYRRLCSMKQGAEMQVKAAVIHCTGAKKQGASKTDALKAFHLFVLPDDWESKIDLSQPRPLRMFNDEPWVDLVDRILNGELRGEGAAPGEQHSHFTLSLYPIEHPHLAVPFPAEHALGAPPPLQTPAWVTEHTANIPASIPPGQGDQPSPGHSQTVLPPRADTQPALPEAPQVSDANFDRVDYSDPSEEGRTPEATAPDPQPGSPAGEDPGRYWKVAVSEEHGREYWYNVLTRETRWSKPDLTA